VSQSDGPFSSPPKTATKKRALRVADIEGRPDVLLGPNTHKTTAAMIAALRNDAELYQRAGSLVHVVRQEDEEPGYARGTPLVRECPLSWLVDRVSEHARCLKLSGEEWKHVPPPGERVHAVLEMGSWSGIRHLRSVVESPTMRPDGTLVQDPGYDAASRTLYIPSAEFPRVPDKPSHSDAVIAYTRIASVFKDFPYVDGSHRSAVIASLLTVLMRSAIIGSVPCFIYDAAGPRSGKSLQMDVVSIIATGRAASRMTFPADDEKELESVLASYAMAGVQIVPFDNIARDFGGAPLDKVITCTNEVDLRVLGKTELRRLPWRATVFGSGNNVGFLGDMLARVLCARLESPLENPEMRDDVDAGTLRRFVTENRPSLVADALTIVRAYVADGSKPQTIARWGGFDEWVARIASAIVWVGAPDPLGARRGLRADEDPSRGAQRVIVSAWSALCAKADVPSLSVSRLLSLIYPPPRGDEPPDGYEELREAVEFLTSAKPGFAPSSKSLGYAIRRLKGRNIGGYSLRLDGETHGIARWRAHPANG
jgi:hypothetical protein